MTNPATPPDEEYPWAPAALRERLCADPLSVLRERGVNAPEGTPPETIREVVHIVSLLWMNGKVIPLEEFQIDPGDEGLIFGRGVWESTRTVNGVPWLWQWHIERMQRTSELLGFPLASDRLPTADQVTAFVRSLTSQDIVIRLNATAGRPGRPGVVWMSAALQPMPYDPLRLVCHRSPVQKGQPYLTLKTFQYATRLRLAQQAVIEGFDTALLIDEDGNIQEAANANIFLRFDDGWVTPTADGGLLPGTVRQFLLQNSPIPMREAVVPVSRLPEVREAFLTNSNLGVVPVASIDQRELPIGEETKQLVNWLTPPDHGYGLRFVERKATPR